MSKIRNQFLGCGCVLISNSCYLSVSYLTKYQKVSPGEIMTTCAVFQLVVFGIQFLVQHFKTPPFERKSLKYDWKTWTALTLANILMTSMNIVCFIAVKMLPLSDFVVLCFTSPIFAIMASVCILRKMPSMLEVFLAMFIIVGATLVSQPNFIFGTIPRDKQYFLGAALSLVAAAQGGFFMATSAKCKDVPMEVFMIQGGVISVIIGVAFCLVVPNPEIRYELDYFGILALMALLTLAGIFFVRLAVKFISPLLVSVMRTMEIVMALLLEIIVSTSLFNFASAEFGYKVAGSLIVTLSAVLLALVSKIEPVLPKMCRSPESSEELEKEIGECDSRDKTDALDAKA